MIIIIIIIWASRVIGIGAADLSNLQTFSKKNTIIIYPRIVGTARYILLRKTSFAVSLDKYNKNATIHII